MKKTIWFILAIILSMMTCMTAWAGFSELVIEDGVLIYIWGGTDEEGTFVIPDDVHTIASEAANEAWFIEKVVIPPNVKTIEKGAFLLSGTIDEVYMSKEIEYLDRQAFAYDQDGFIMYVYPENKAVQDYIKNYSLIEGGEVVFRSRYRADLDNDGDVNLEDAKAALEHALGIVEFNNEKKLCMDQNCDGYVDLKDANCILKTALGIPT